MKNEDVENMLRHMEVPKPEQALASNELKIPVLSYRKSSRAGFWLLLLPATAAVAVFLKSDVGIRSAWLDWYHRLFAAIDGHPVLTYLIPLLFAGLPLAVIIINFLAICHFQKGRRELLLTIKYRPGNILLLLVSLAVLVFFLLPDKLSFG